MKSLLFILLTVMSFTIISCQVDPAALSETKKPSFDYDKTKLKAKEALAFCQNKKFNTDYCILADMSLHSGLKRFFVWDFKKDTISYSFMVSHGCGDNPWSYDYSREKPKFSNVDGSHCSSLGKYKIGQRAWSDWGIHVKYVLHGLESTNSNALSRFIVFHSWEQIPDNEVYPYGTPEGWGCPSISNASMEIMDAMLKKTNQPTLLWMYH